MPAGAAARQCSPRASRLRCPSRWQPANPPLHSEATRPRVLLVHAAETVAAAVVQTWMALTRRRSRHRRSRSGHTAYSATRGARERASPNEVRNFQAQGYRRLYSRALHVCTDRLYSTAVERQTLRCSTLIHTAVPLAITDPNRHRDSDLTRWVGGDNKQNRRRRHRAPTERSVGVDTPPTHRATSFRKCCPLSCRAAVIIGWGIVPLVATSDPDATCGRTPWNASLARCERASGRTDVWERMSRCTE